MRKFISHLVFAYFIFGFSACASGEIIDPEVIIQENGYHSLSLGDDGKTLFYSYTERVSPNLLSVLEHDITQLPKHIDVMRMCDFLRGGVKATLIEKNRAAIDVVLVNYGFSGSTIVCSLKYMQNEKIGTQLIFSKKGYSGMYLVFMID